MIEVKDNESHGEQVRRSGKGKIEVLNGPVQKLVSLECSVHERKDEVAGREVVDEV